MSPAEQTLHDDKVRAEIVNLNAQTANFHAQTAEIQQNMRYRFWVLAGAYVGALAVVVRFL